MHEPEFYIWSELPATPAGAEGGRKRPEKMAARFRQPEQEIKTLMRITEQVNRGVTVEEILDFLYQEMQQVIPYNRIGVALIEEQGIVVSRCVRSDQPIFLKEGYKGKLAGSTLERVVETGKPRIINDLEAYSRNNPQSRPTKLILREGMRSSLTCPLIIQSKPVGFVFFTSVNSHTYSDLHIAFFQHIAGHISTIVEKGRLHDELARQRELVEQRNEVMTRELEMARNIQRALIPRQPPLIPGLELALKYEPASQVGGDVVDIMPQGDGRAVLFIADAMGHGVQAALVMSMVKATLYPAVQSNPHPGRVLESINAQVARLFGDDYVTFVTAACCLVDAGKMRAELALAGHRTPLWFRAESHEVAERGSGSLPLGVTQDGVYQTESIELSSGDALVFSTDGVMDAFAPDGSSYGAARFQNEVLRHGARDARKLCDHMWRDLDAHCRGRAKEDDVRLLVAKDTQKEERAERTGCMRELSVPF